MQEDLSPQPHTPSHTHPDTPRDLVIWLWMQLWSKEWSNVWREIEWTDSGPKDIVKLWKEKCRPLPSIRLPCLPPPPSIQLPCLPPPSIQLPCLSHSNTNTDFLSELLHLDSTLLSHSPSPLNIPAHSSLLPCTLHPLPLSIYLPPSSL